MNAGSQKGAALITAIITATVLALAAVYSLNWSYNQTRQVNAVGIRRTMIYYRGQAGLIDAAWRIRTDHAPPGSPAGSSFTGANFDPPAYFIDIDTDTASASENAGSDVKVDIGKKDAATGLRRIESSGLDK